MGSNTPDNWDELKLREACVAGTQRERQAYLDSGYEHLVMGCPPPAPPKPTKMRLALPPMPTIEQPKAEDYLCHDFTGYSRMMEVANAVCKKHNITFKALTGNGRHRSLVVARRELYYICYFKLGKSTTQIGNAFKRDHTTIVHHLQVACGTRSVSYFRVQDAKLHS